MSRTLLFSLVAAAMLATAGGAVGSDQVKRYNFENAWPSKVTGQKKGGGLKAKTTTRKKESGEKGGTEDINIGVGELQEGKARPKLKKR